MSQLVPKLIVGLGNPGSQYTKTRHNAGFMVIDRLAETHAKGAIPKARFKAVTIDAELKGPQGTERCVLMKPTTYMNLSGQAVGEAIRFFKLQPSTDLLVLVDDFYLPVGAVRIGRINGEFIINPTQSQRLDSDLDLVYVGNKTDVIMIEGAANELPEAEFVKALHFAQAEVTKIVAAQEELTKLAGKPKMEDDTARQSIDFLLRSSGDRPQVSITFFGGETLLNFPAIRNGNRRSYKSL